MAFSLVMQAPTGAGIGGQFVGASSGTVYTTNSNGQITVTSQSDVDYFLKQGFYAATTVTAKVSFLAPLPADTTGSSPAIVTAVTPTNVALTIAAQPPQARKILVQMHIGTTTTTAVTAGSVALVGTDQDGNAVSDTVSLIANATAVFKTANCYAGLTSATVSGYVASGSGTGNTIAIGQSNDFGLPTGQGVANLALNKINKIITTFTSSTTAGNIAWARVVSDDNAAGATLDTAARTVAPTTAPGVSGINDYEIEYTYQLRA